MPNGSAAQGYGTSSVPVGSTVVLVVSKGPSPAPTAGVVVPDTVGVAQADALESVQAAGLNAQVFTVASGAFARGKVVGQWPHASEAAAPGSTTALLVSAGPAAEGTALTGVPSVIGQTEMAALGTLDRYGLRGHTINEYSATAPAGVVFGQLPDESALAAAPKKKSPWLWVVLAAIAVLAIVGIIAFMASRGGAEMVVVPNVVGMPLADAQEALTEKGLVTGEITEEKNDSAAVGTVLEQDPAVGKELEKGSAVDLVVVAGAEMVKVPDVVGRTKETAQQILTDAKLEVSFTEAPSDTVAAGTVVSQSPKAGQEVSLGTQVGVVVSKGPEQKNVTVPDLSGLTEQAASQKLGEVGLDAEFVDVTSETVPEGSVVSQAPPAGASVAKGTQIAVLISSGPATSEGELVQVPNVVGKALTDAVAIINDLGLEVTSLKADGSGKPADQVVYQTPAAGDTAPLGSQVVVIVSSGS